MCICVFGVCTRLYADNSNTGVQCGTNLIANNDGGGRQCQMSQAAVIYRDASIIHVPIYHRLLDLLWSSPQ